MIITKKCLRYIIPFTFQDNFSALCNKIDTQKSEEWKRVYGRTGKRKGSGESDLYQYVRNEFLSESPENPSDVVKMGITWRDVKNRKQPLCQLRFLNEPITKETECFPSGIDFSISDLGLLLFRNNLGFFWYEIETANEMDSQELVRFQNIYKELNRAGKCMFWEKRGEGEFAPFSMGNWIAEKLSFLNPVYLPQRKNAYKSLLLKNLRVANHLQELKITENDAEQLSCREYVPDKALLFTYGVFGETEKPVATGREEKILSYYLTNGYKQSYLCSEDTLDRMHHPFSNVIWYATQEGCSYLAWPDDSNKKFFCETMPGKIKNDYFALYLKCLFQSYSLFLYAQKIQDSLSAETKDYLTTAQSQLVTELYGDLNLFLTKTMATSVSHIDHQSSFYVYVRARLCIVEDVKSVTAGLDSLENLLREIHHREEMERWKKENLENALRDQEEKERDLQMQRVMYLFSLLTIFSAFTDGFAFMDQFVPVNNIYDIFQSVPAMIAYGVIALFIIVLSGMTVWHSVKFYISSRKKGKRKD